jgi:hypothetical protein
MPKKRLQSMRPPDSCQPYPPPAYGYQQPGQYPAQYPGHYPGQYPPQYPYPYYAPPPQKRDPAKILAIIVVVVVLLVVMTVAIAGFLVVYLQTLPSSGGNGETPPFGLRVETTASGGWLVSVTAASFSTSSVRLQVIDPSTGLTTVSKMMSHLAPTYNDPDATYNDNNDNSKLDAGDTIQLKSSGGHILAGYKVQLLSGENIIGTIMELPA